MADLYTGNNPAATDLSKMLLDPMLEPGMLEPGAVLLSDHFADFAATTAAAPVAGLDLPSADLSVGLPPSSPNPSLASASSTPIPAFPPTALTVPDTRGWPTDAAFPPPPPPVVGAPSLPTPTTSAYSGSPSNSALSSPATSTTLATLAFPVSPAALPHSRSPEPIALLNGVSNKSGRISKASTKGVSKKKPVASGKKKAVKSAEERRAKDKERQARVRAAKKAGEWTPSRYREVRNAKVRKLWPEAVVCTEPKCKQLLMCKEESCTENLYTCTLHTRVCHCRTRGGGGSIFDDDDAQVPLAGIEGLSLDSPPAKTSAASAVDDSASAGEEEEEADTPVAESVEPVKEADFPTASTERAEVVAAVFAAAKQVVAKAADAVEETEEEEQEEKKKEEKKTELTGATGAENVDGFEYDVLEVTVQPGSQVVHVMALEVEPVAAEDDSQAAPSASSSTEVELVSMLPLDVEGQSYVWSSSREEKENNGDADDAEESERCQVVRFFLADDDDDNSSTALVWAVGLSASGAVVSVTPITC